MAGFREPLLIPCAGFAAGIALHRWTVMSWGETLAAALAVSLLAWVANRMGSPRLVVVCLTLAFVFAGTLNAIWRSAGAPPELDAESGELVSVSGCVIEPPRLSEDREQFTVELAPRARARVNLYLKDGESPPPLEYGQQVEVIGRVRKPRNYRNEGAFDIERFLARERVFWQISARSADPVSIKPGTCGNAALGWIYHIRTRLLNQIDHLFGESAPKVAALLIGESAKLDRSWTDSFRRTGTYHALVVSGTHVTVLAAILLILLRALFLPELPALAAITTLTWMYAVIAGGTAPVTRAAAGFTLFLVCRFFYRQARLLNLLAAVAFVFLVLDPESLFDASFQLSFGALAAICLFALPLDDRWIAPLRTALRGLPDVRRDLRLDPPVAALRVELRLIGETVSLWTRLPLNFVLRSWSVVLRFPLLVASVILASAAVQLGLALAFVVYFHRFAVTALLANVGVVMLLEWAIPTGFAALATGWTPLAAATTWLIDTAARLAEWHVRWEPQWRIPSPPSWLAAAFALSLLLLAITLRRKPKLFAIPALAACLVVAVIVAHPFPAAASHEQLEFTAIDVGQGDALLLLLPDGTRMAVDAGGFPSFGRKARPMDVGEQVVAPYLWSRSITALDIVVLTHAHADHMGGVRALIDNFHPRELWISGLGKSGEFDSVLAHAHSRGTRVVTLREGAKFRYGGATVRVVTPLEGAKNPGLPHNNDSLGLTVRFGRHSFLLPGDAERTVEENIAAIPDLGHIDILKVAHHGGRTSTTQTLVDAARPGFAIVSVGENNRFGHPHPDVLGRLAAMGSTVLRTDRDGRITIRSDGRHLTLETFRTAHYGPR